MLTVAWLIPAGLLVALLTIVIRRVLLHFSRLRHGLVLVVAVIGATGIAMAVVYGAAPRSLFPAIGVAVLISGLAIGFLLNALELRKPHDG